MMINKRLINTVSQSKKYIAGNVAAQWCSLAANITMMAFITTLLQKLYDGTAEKSDIVLTLCAALAAIAVRFICAVVSSKMSFLSSKAVKKVLREKIYDKLLKLGASYNEKTKTSEVVQVAVEGVDQLETYFGAYLPQFFYAMLAPLTLFAVICTVDMLSAAVLLICVPLIPVSIIVVQRWAKKLLSKYWGQYTALGDTFLENLQGLTTLKIYQADEFKQQEMNKEAENFRRITMKVLTMQLNSITIMDLIAYGGAAIGGIIAVSQFVSGKVSLGECLFIILIAADFFIPMRQLGSFFHIAMNGMAASDKIFRLLDINEEPGGRDKNAVKGDIVAKNLSFAYEKERQILKNIDAELINGGFTAIVGESGCGKSTFASILMGRNRNYSGSVKIGENELSDIFEQSLFEHITYVGHSEYLFKGTVKENLLMAKPSANENELWNVLERVNLSEFLKNENGLDTFVMERGSNFSGGQSQRLALARALLHDSPVYIFDEATSNIDVESENDIMNEIIRLAETKTVILISHRLANVTKADKIYVFENGTISESGTHSVLLKKEGTYAKLWNSQQNLENYRKEKA